MNEIKFKKTSATSIKLADLHKYMSDENVKMFAPIYLYIKIPLRQDGSADQSNELLIHNFIHNNTSVDMNFNRCEEGGVNYMNSYITLNAHELEILARDINIPIEDILKLKTDPTSYHFEKYFFMVEGYSILWNIIGTSSTTQGIKINNMKNTYIIPKKISTSYSDIEIREWENQITKIHNFMIKCDCLYVEGFQLQCKADRYMVCGTRKDFDNLLPRSDDFEALEDIRQLLVNEEQTKSLYNLPKIFS